MKACLRLCKTSGPVAEFPLEGRVEIGRADVGWNLVLRREGKEIGLSVRDATASRKHALLYFENEQLMIRDIGSLNGTTVNDRILPEWVKKRGSAPLPLKGGSVIKIGNTEMEISIDAAPSFDDLMNLARDVGLESELRHRHPLEEAQRLAISFRIILDISEHCCNTSTKVKELNSKLETLKGYLGDDATIAETDNLQRLISAELFEEEYLHETQVWEVKDFCHRFVEQWSSRFMK
ncbi:FHA domain-containing protein [Chloroflexota bacterium]